MRYRCGIEQNYKNSKLIYIINTFNSNFSLHFMGDKLINKLSKIYLDPILITSRNKNDLSHPDLETI